MIRGGGGGGDGDAFSQNVKKELVNNAVDTCTALSAKYGDAGNDGNDETIVEMGA